MANSSMLVLPRITTPRSRSRLTTVASYGGMNSSRIRDPAVVRIPLVTSTSLRARGTPASGPSGSPRSRRWSTRPASPGSRCLLDDPGHLEPVLLDLGRGRQRLVPGQAGAGHVLAPGVDPGQRVGGRRHPLGRQPPDLLGLLEDHRQLGLEAVELLIGEGEAGEAGDVLDVGTADRHGDKSFERSWRSAESTVGPVTVAAGFPQPARPRTRPGPGDATSGAPRPGPPAR